jgi:ComF family protein
MSPLRALLDALAPRRCAGCAMPGAAPVCQACVELCDLLAPPPPRATPYGACHAALPFEPPVRAIVHHAKYRGHRDAAALLGALVVDRLWLSLRTAVRSTGPPVVVPVPLGRRRLRTRGYNQAALLAAALAGQAGVPLSDLAARTRETPPQVGRRGDQRRVALDGAFAWRGPWLAGRPVWLVDDVVTTGATLAAAATALQQAGAGRIDGVAAAMVGAP